MRPFSLPACLLLLAAGPLFAKGGDTAPYFGQKLPGGKPERFAPPILAGFPFLGRIAFAPDGQSCFFTVSDATWSSQKLMTTRLEKGVWLPPEHAPFAAEFEKAGEPFFSADGKSLTFNASQKASPSGADFWRVTRTAQGWSAPVRLSEAFQSKANDLCFTQTSDGTGYFLSRRLGLPQLFRVRPGAEAAELLPAPITAEGVPNGDPCIAPDGRFLVFFSFRQGGFGSGDLFTTFPDGKGGWTEPMNLGPDFNSAGSEYGPSLSPDGRFLFFVRHTREKGELFWVATSALERFRK